MTLTILSLEDEAEVRQALERDLEEFDGRVRLELAEDASDAWSVVEEIESDKALNQAGLDYYIAKPWDPQTLRNVVREQLTDYVLETGIDPLPYMPVLDGVRIMESIR